MDKGIAIIHQELYLRLALSMGENIFLGHEPTHASGRIDEKSLYREAAVDDAINAVKAGEMAATVSQQPDKSGSMGIAAAKVLAGKSLEEYVPVDLMLAK